MNATSRNGASTLWIVLLTVASTVTTLLLACATPFAALAALAALHMRQRDGIILMLFAWAASQAIGFGVLHYPHDPKTLAWGVGLATAAVASVLGACAALRPLAGKPLAVRLVAAYLAAFVALTLIVALWALVLGGIAITLNPAILLRQLARNGAILMGLFALYHGLVAIGVPAARSRLAAA
jgi:hypothetical protein